MYVAILILLLCLCENGSPKNSYKSGEVHLDYPKGCAHLRCKRAGECVSRKFWCKNPPCPRMLYCAQSPKESMRGPSLCETVRCSKGYMCLVSAHHCRWGEGCEQQIARCVSERDHKESPESCIDSKCSSGFRCILRESSCVQPPCKLRKACANTTYVNVWLEKCKSLGCLSEKECFLRRPEQDCPNAPCKYTPNCSAKSEEELETRELCRGWVCPKEHECSAHIKGPCKPNSCSITRSCHKPLIIPVDTPSSPQHSWRDDIQLSFHPKQKNNITNPRKNRFSSRHAVNNIPSGNIATVNEKNASNLADTNFNPNGKLPVHVSSLNSRPLTSRSFSAGPDIISGRVGKPAVTSLTTWLNHLKVMTGVHAIEVWIRRADRQEDYGEFVEWLDSVKDMLGSAAFDLWLEEVRAMTVTSEAFQSWLPPNPTDRTVDTHQLVETNDKSTGGSDEGFRISDGSQDSSKYPSNDNDTNDFQPGIIQKTRGMRNNQFEPENHLIVPTNYTARKNAIITGENSILSQPAIRPTQRTIGINEWSQVYPPNPRNFPQAHSYQKKFRDIVPWGNQAVPYQRFDNTGLLDPAYQQFQSNRSFQQIPNTNGDFLRSDAWQGQLFPSLYNQWQLLRNPRDQISPDRRIHDLTQIPPNYFPHLREGPFKFYSKNSTPKYLVNPYDNSRLIVPETFGSYPIDGRNYGYPSWPSSSYERQSLMNVRHHPLKHDDSSGDSGRFHWNDRNEQRSEEKLSDPRKDSSLDYSRFPWNFMDPRLQAPFPYSLDHNRRNLDEKNNRDGSAILSSLSRTHRVDSDPRLSLANRYFPDNERQIYGPEYHWTNSYPHDRLYEISEGHLPSRSIKSDPSPELKPPEEEDESTRRFILEERINDVPGQAMGLPDLWNSRYRNPFSSIPRTLTNEKIGNPDTITKNLPASTTKSPPVVPSLRPVVTSRILPISKENFQHKDDNHEYDENKFDDYSAEEDDGIYPLLLSLQGYIESPSREVFQDSMNPRKNFTILPVYAIESDVHTDDHYDDDDEFLDENHAIHLSIYSNEKYSGSPDFPDNLRSIFDVKTSLILQNQTGDDDIEIKDIMREYEDNEEPNNEEDPSKFLDLSLSYHHSRDGSSNNDEAGGWFGNVDETLNEERPGTDYYDERVDYEDEEPPRDRSYSDFENLNEDGLLNHEDISDNFNDHLYLDPEHIRLKKNRPV